MSAEEKREAAAAVESKKSVAAEESAASEAAAEADRLAAHQARYDDCLRQLRPLVSALTVVDARLDVGLSQSDYSDLVGEASVAYNRIDPDELGAGPCLSAGAKLEDALNSYSTIASKWNDCIFDYGCDVDSLDPVMQAKWLSASLGVERAEKLMDKLDPESPDFQPDPEDSA